ncbi:MAG: DinB family protein [Chloroflexi bacterium]|nr:DinB family protein [Chloroflexota bacterium]
MEYLRSRDIKSVPVTIIDDAEVIIGYYPKKLIPALKLNVKIDLSSKTSWLAEKYDIVLNGAIRATQQLTDDQLQQEVPWRPWSVRDCIVHIISFPELAWLSHKQGSMSTDDMAASNLRIKDVATVETITQYGHGVLANIDGFLKSGDTASFDRVVPAHYGGEVTVTELLNIILSHSTHHLKQIYWYMEQDLGITPLNPVTEEDTEGIVTPTALI